jgi:hypothetical protein
MNKKIWDMDKHRGLLRKTRVFPRPLIAPQFIFSANRTESYEQNCFIMCLNLSSLKKFCLAIQKGRSRNRSRRSRIKNFTQSRSRIITMYSIYSKMHILICISMLRYFLGHCAICLFLLYFQTAIPTFTL